MVIDQKFISKEYEPVVYEIGREKIKEFAKAVKADASLFEDLIPPTFPVVYSTRLLSDILYDKEMKLNLKKLVHGEQVFAYHKPVKIGDTITSKAKVEKIFQKGSHDFIVFKVDSFNQNNELACESTWTLVVRGGNDTDFSLQEKVAMKISSMLAYFRSEPDHNGSEPVKFEKKDNGELEMQVTIDKYMPQVYAGASGDFNAIHLDARLGRKVGLGTYILHGMATMAMGANLALKECELKAIKKYRTRFSAPVKPFDVLTYKGKKDGNKFTFTAKNQNGEDVLSMSELELAQ